MFNLNVHQVSCIEIQPVCTVNDGSWQDVRITTQEGQQLVITMFPCASGIEVETPQTKTGIPRLVAFGPNHHCIIVGEKTYYYSYLTCVAYSDTISSFRIRSVSRTTGRHMSAMGIAHFPILEDEEFEKHLS